MKNRLLISIGLAALTCSAAYAAIPDGWAVEPADGATVTEIKTFVVTKNNGKFDPYVNKSIKINDVDYLVTQKISGSDDGTNTITLKDAVITDPGTYNIVIPESTFDYNYDWYMEEGDPSPEISFTLKIDAPSPWPEMVTIEGDYNLAYCGEKVNVHYWGGESDSSWPGVAMTSVQGSDGKTYKVAKVPEGTKNVIFNTNGNEDQTGNLVYTARYIMGDSGATNLPVRFRNSGDTDPEPVTITGDFNLAYSGDKVNLYYYGGVADASWPGVNMGTAEGSDGKTYQVYKVPENTTTVIFNTEGNADQTADLPFTGRYIMDDLGATAVPVVFEAGEPPVPVEPITITGDYNLAYSGTMTNVHYWGGESDSTWPGVAMESAEASDGNTYKVYKVPAGTTNVIFTNSDGSSQTGNLTYISEYVMNDLGATTTPVLFEAAGDDFVPIENENYVITPEQGKVGKIESFSVTYTRTGLFPEGYGSNKPVLVNEETGATVATFSVGEGGGMYDVTLSLAEAYTEPGTYLVRIPANAISDFNDDDWPAADFRYVIDSSIVVVDPVETVIATPASESTVSTLSEVLLTFPDIAEVYANGPEKDNVVVKKNGETTEIKGAFSFDAAAMAANEMTLSFTPAITEAGEYEIYVPARALNLYASSFDSRHNYEFTIKYTVKGILADGTKIKVEPLTYLVVSGTDRTLSVTFPAKESEYSGVTAVPATVEYDGETWTVVEIGKLAFSEVTGISSIEIPTTVTKIGDAAFWESSLSEIVIPTSVTTIGEGAFEHCSLKEIEIPESVTSLGEDTFMSCTALESIKLNNVITRVPGSFAAGCTKLAKIEIPQCVDVIGEFAFSECEILSDVTLPDNLATVERFAFAYTPGLQKLTLPETVTTIGNGIFYQSGLTEATLPENLTVIPDGTFQCCTKIKDFVVSNNITDIEKEAFYWCFALESITLGEKVATIGSDCFKSDAALTTVTSLNPEPPVGAKFEESVYANATLYVPEGAKDAYAAADGWKEFSKIMVVGTGVDAIGGDSDFAIETVANGISVAADGIVNIYDASGKCVYTGKGGVIELEKGLYIVVAGKKAVKVAL